VFAKAYGIASQFTQPVILSIRLFDGTVDCLLGAFTILNKEGWIVTVRHMIDPGQAAKEHAGQIAEHLKNISDIESNPRLTYKQKRRALSKHRANPKWITNYSYWWGMDGRKVEGMFILPEADIALGKLEPFRSDEVSAYPIIKNPQNLMIGTSLCKLGFPFHKISATFDEKTGNFRLADGTLPVPRFPLEGLYTRNAIAGWSKDKKYQIKFLETSSPGLRGQSGGPIFDAEGVVWSIQSRTAHLPLGFSPKIVRNGKEIEENQFLNVGIGVHPELLVQFLQDHNVEFQLSDD
jgi:hypothetical protein